MLAGTGIFESPRAVMAATQSAGVSLLFWFFGIFYCLSGVHVYMEYGINAPRYVIDGVEQGVPRSGGDLNYVSLADNHSTIPSKGPLRLPDCTNNI